MKKLLFLLLIYVTVACSNKKEIVENLRKNPDYKFQDYVNELGDPILTRIDDSQKGTLKRTWFTFLLEESSENECNLDLYEGKKVLDHVVEISFEKPMQVSYGCMRSQKELDAVKEEILTCVKGKKFTASKLSGGVAGSLEFNSDMTYIYSIYILGGFVSKGTWEIYNGDLESATIKLTPPSEQVKSGNLPNAIYVTAFKDCKLKIDETTYYSK
jgi:hypothetical protein